MSHWDDDKLERKASALFLTNYLTKRYDIVSKKGQPDSLVMGFRAEWGSGKTYFVTRWAKDLADLNYPVVYFDAWFNDFTEDPLIGFIASLEKDLKEHFKKIPKAQKLFEEATSIAKKLIKPAGFLISAIAAKQLTGYAVGDLREALGDVGVNGSTVDELVTEYSKALLKEHREKQDLIQSFKNKLQSLVDQLTKESNIQLPIIIFVDELDRCRPTYAIELLESIKHLFGVAGIYFVISTNTEQLGHSICSVYGEKFDSERYLKRFFEQEYLLAPPDTFQFCAFLFERPILSALEQKKTFYISHQNFHKDQFLGVVELSKLCAAFDLHLRDIEQICLTLEAVLVNWPEGERIHYTYLLCLIITKHISSATFQRIYANSLSVTELDKFLNQKLKSDVKLKTYQHKDSFNQTPAEFTVQQVFSAYINATRLNTQQLNESNDYKTFTGSINGAIANDSARGWSGSPPMSIVTQYPKRVAEAGQLHIGLSTDAP